MRGAVAAASIALLAVACSSSPSAPPPRPSPAPTTLASGAVAVAVVHTCGAGGKQCPALFRRALGHVLKGQDGLPFATPDTVIFPSTGCGGSLRAPYGMAIVTGGTVRWHVDWVGGGPDCDGTVIGFVRFAHPVYDMHSRLALVSTQTNVGEHRHIYRSAFFPAPQLAHWVNPNWPA